MASGVIERPAESGRSWNSCFRRISSPPGCPGRLGGHRQDHALVRRSDRGTGPRIPGGVRPSGQAETVLIRGAGRPPRRRRIGGSRRVARVQRLAVDRVLLRATAEGPSTDESVVAAAFASIIDRLATDASILVAIDDVQWLDPSSQAVLAVAARRFTGRVGLLITERTEHEGASAATWLQLTGPDGIGRIHIGPLSLGGLHALVSSRLGRSFPRPTMVRIAEISGGNPFYALELARAVDAGGSQAVLPATLAELMRLRIGRLERETQDLLLAAACAANPTVELLAQVTGTTVKRAAEFSRLEAKGIIALDGDVCSSRIRCWREACTRTRPRASGVRCTGRFRRR